MSLKVGIVGAAGYAGAELIRSYSAIPSLNLLPLRPTPMPASRCPQCIRALLA